MEKSKVTVFFPNNFSIPTLPDSQKEAENVATGISQQYTDAAFESGKHWNSHHTQENVKGYGCCSTLSAEYSYSDEHCKSLQSEWKSL